MKRNILYTCLLILFPLFGNAQTMGGSLKASSLSIQKTARIILTPQFTFSRKNHEWRIGPSVVVGAYQLATDQNYPKLAGANAEYYWYPTGIDQKFTFFLFSSLSVYQFENFWTSTIWDESIQNYNTYDFEGEEIMLTNQVGYGLKLQIGGKLIVQQAVGIGGYYSDSFNETETPNSPKPTTTRLNGYDAYGFVWGIHLSVGYRIFKEK